MTEKLYYLDSHMREFDAVVTSCEEADGCFLVTLDRTAFFPEGGGQAADTGFIGSVAVLDVQERGGEVVHSLPSPLTPGSRVHGSLDWEKRFQNMQLHSGEHIVSGIVHALFGYDNVGFHMGAEGVIVDFSGFLSDEDIRRVECRANEVIWENHPITTRFPAPEELPSLTYRSKLDLTENVRLVTIEGVDVCACCAPHVCFTGEVGLIRLLDSIRRKEGVRIRMLAGLPAYLDMLRRTDALREASRLLSAKPELVPESVEKLLAERDGLAYRLKGFRLREIEELIASQEGKSAPFLYFSEEYTADECRRLANGAAAQGASVAAVFSGSDASGYQYVIASSSIPLREALKPFNAALNGKGGGSDNMVQGSVRAGRDAIQQEMEGFIPHENQR